MLYKTYLVVDKGDHIFNTGGPGLVLLLDIKGFNEGLYTN